MTSFYVKTFLAAGKVVQVFPDVFPTKYGWFTRLLKEVVVTSVTTVMSFCEQGGERLALAKWDMVSAFYVPFR